MRQSEWVTRMARLAATEFGADWVINSDADEFWWPHGGSLKDVLATVPSRYGVVRGCWRHFVARPRGPEDFAERMTVRLSVPGSPGDKETIYHAHQKVAHRAARDVQIEAGNHNADGPGLEPLRAWHPIEVLHFSLRTPEQVRSKAQGGWLRNPQYEAAPHQLLFERCRHGRGRRGFLRVTRRRRYCAGTWAGRPALRDRHEGTRRAQAPTVSGRGLSDARYRDHKSPHVPDAGHRRPSGICRRGIHPRRDRRGRSHRAPCSRTRATARCTAAAATRPCGIATSRPGRPACQS